MLPLKDKIINEIKLALKGQDKKRLQALRFLQAAIKNKEIEVRPKELAETDVLNVIKKQVKQIQESIEGYGKIPGYEEKIKEEKYNLEQLQSFLPKALSEKELISCVEKAISETQAQSMKDMGQVMQACAKASQGRADAKKLAQIVKERLSNL